MGGERAVGRRVIAVAGEVAEEAYSAPEDVGDTLDHAETLVFEVADRRVADSEGKVSDSLHETPAQLEQLPGQQRLDPLRGQLYPRDQRVGDRGFDRFIVSRESGGVRGISYV